jgi:hypothetical protein
MSSCEAEYIALTSAIKECLWLRDILREVGVVHKGPTVILQDNQSTIQLSKDPVFHSKTKHIQLAFHYAREKQRAGDVAVEYIPTKEQPADYLTKNAPKDVLFECMRLVGQIVVPS